MRMHDSVPSIGVMKPESASPVLAFRDWFLPASLRERPGALDPPGARWVERRRTQRFLALLLVVGVATTVSSVAQCAQGLWVSGLAAGGTGVIVLAVLMLIRGGGWCSSARSRCSPRRSR